MKTRILSGLLMSPLLIILFIGGAPLYVTGLILTILAIREFSNALKTKNIPTRTSLSIILTVCLFILNILSIDISSIEMLLFSIMFIFLILIFFRKDKVNSFIYLIGSLYIILGFNSIGLISSKFENGTKYMWLVFVIALLSDIMAYFTGSFFGKHKLAPTLSPKKTIEGSIGAIIFSSLGCFIFGIIFNLNTFFMILIGLIGSVVSQVGDLLASLIKRYVGIKDYGNLIPGHGGILDRFDSIILVAQFIYLVLLFIN